MKTFSFVVCHSGSKPLGDSIPEDHAAWTMTAWEDGPALDKLAVGEGGHIRRATTADGKMDTFVRGKRKSVPILYSVTRLT